MSVYRNEDKRAVAQKWQGWADMFQFGTLGMLFVTIFVLNNLSKAAARVAVWYFVSVIFIGGTVGFVFGEKARKLQKSYFDAEHTRMLGFFDEAETALKSKSKAKRFIAKYRG